MTEAAKATPVLNAGLKSHSFTTPVLGDAAKAATQGVVSAAKPAAIAADTVNYTAQQGILKGGPNNLTAAVAPKTGIAAKASKLGGWIGNHKMASAGIAVAVVAAAAYMFSSKHSDKVEQQEQQQGRGGR
jgi:hypothetical protein